MKKELIIVIIIVIAIIILDTITHNYTKINFAKINEQLEQIKEISEDIYIMEKEQDIAENTSKEGKENNNKTSKQEKLKEKIKIEGLTLIPLKLYFKKNYVKVLVGICKGKKLYDKRASIKERDLKRETRYYN